MRAVAVIAASAGSGGCAMVGLRVSEDEEAEGLDITAHGERGYNL